MRKLSLLALLLLFVSLPASATITVVQHTHATPCTGTTSCAVAFASNVTSGSSCVYVSSANETATGNMNIATDSNSNTIVLAKLNDSASGAVRIDYVKNCNAGATTVTAHCGQAGSRLHLHIYEISGLNTSSPLDQTNNGTQAATSQSISTSSPTTTASEIVFGIFYDFPNNDSLTAGSGFSPSEFTDGGSGNETLLTEVKIVSSTGTQTATATCGSGTNTIRQIIATFAASGSTPITIMPPVIY